MLSEVDSNVGLEDGVDMFPKDWVESIGAWMFSRERYPYRTMKIADLVQPRVGSPTLVKRLSPWTSYNRLVPRRLIEMVRCGGRDREFPESTRGGLMLSSEYTANRSPHSSLSVKAPYFNKKSARVLIEKTFSHNGKIWNKEQGKSSATWEMTRRSGVSGIQRQEQWSEVETSHSKRHPRPLLILGWHSTSARSSTTPGSNLEPNQILIQELRVPII